MEQVIMGVDPHKLSVPIAVLDPHERLLGSGRFTTDQAGYAPMRKYEPESPVCTRRSRRHISPLDSNRSKNGPLRLLGVAIGAPRRRDRRGVIDYHVDEGVLPYGEANARDGHRLVDVVEASGCQPLNSDACNGSRPTCSRDQAGHVELNDTTSPP